ncbi:MAG: branched-chain amino acid ABC transporter permease [Spirochaetaceae bacterium]|nr:branched-chain amino acid ABC transporter permease [Spirochaetaceae bacterium]
MQSDSIKRAIPWMLSLAVLALLPVTGLLRGSFLSHVLVMILLNASMAQAWNIIGGYAGQVSFGHSVFFGIGAYGAAYAVTNLKMTPYPGALAGAVLAAVLAVIIGYPTFKLKGHYFAIATFAIVEVFHRLFMIWEDVGGAVGLDYPILKDGWRNFSWSRSKVGYFYGALILFGIIFSLVRALEKARFGYYLKAIREGQETAESLGVDARRYKLAAMALSAAMAAMCGAFFAQYNYRVDPSMVLSLDMSMRFVLITILGGIGTLWGPLLGAAILIPLQEYTRAYLAKLGPGVDLVIFGLIIILVMQFQPKGIMGMIDAARKRRRKLAAAGNEHEGGRQ